MQDNANIALVQELVAFEKQVWDALVTGDMQADQAMLSNEFLGVYPDGFSGRSEHAGQLSSGPSIARYHLSDYRALPLGQDFALLCYHARYLRSSRTREEEMYVSSIWQRDGGGWINVFSQDTPAV